MTDFSGAPRARALLVIAYIFPPFFSPGGSIRVVKFLKYLPALGWRPVVLTVDDRREYEHLRRVGSEELLRDLPPEVDICRTGEGEPPADLMARGRAARDKSRAARALINGLRDLRAWAHRWLLVPDENILWLPFALRTGRRLVRERQIDALFVTCPPNSAAVIGALLAWLTRKPLVVDFRDDWIDTPWYWHQPGLVRAVNRWLERRVIDAAARVIAVTPASLAAIRRHERAPDSKFRLIPNGVDLADFSDQGAAQPTRNGQFTMVHAGLLTAAPGEWQRSPAALFRALASIRATDPDIAADIRLLFTAALPPEYRALVENLGLGEMVQEIGYLPRAEFTGLLRGSDLLVAINYEQYATLVPGKLYEYWAVGGPPILLLSHPGAAQELVTRHALGTALLPDDEAGIRACVLEVYRRRAAGHPVRIERDGIEAYDRPRLAASLSEILEEIVSGR